MNADSTENNPTYTVENTGEGAVKHGEDGGEVPYDELVRRISGKTTAQVLARLQNQDYIGKIATDLYKADTTIRYHIEKLQDYGLVRRTGETDGRVYYQITDKGEVLLERVNVPTR